MYKFADFLSNHVEPREYNFILFLICTVLFSDVFSRFAGIFPVILTVLSLDAVIPDIHASLSVSGRGFLFFLLYHRKNRLKHDEEA